MRWLQAAVSPRLIAVGIQEEHSGAQEKEGDRDYTARDGRKRRLHDPLTTHRENAGCSNGRRGQPPSVRKIVSRPHRGTSESSDRSGDPDRSQKPRDAAPCKGESERSQTEGEKRDPDPADMEGVLSSGQVLSPSR